jgi:sulfur carrier protein
MRVTINGVARELPEGARIADALRAVGVDADERGVAVAVDAEVVPRAGWNETTIPDGARLEIVRATAGG